MEIPRYLGIMPKLSWRREWDSVTSPRLLARLSTPPRAVALRLSHLLFSRIDAPLGLHSAVLADHCGESGIRTHGSV